MTNDEIRMTKETRNPNAEARKKPEVRMPNSKLPDFGLRASFVIRHSDFGFAYAIRSFIRARNDSTCSFRSAGIWARPGAPGFCGSVAAWTFSSCLSISR